MFFNPFFSGTTQLTNLLLIIASVSSWSVIDRRCSNLTDRKLIQAPKDQIFAVTSLGDNVALDCKAKYAAQTAGFQLSDISICWTKFGPQGVSYFFSPGSHPKQIEMEVLHSHVVHPDGTLYFGNAQKSDNGTYECHVNVKPEKVTFVSQILLEVWDCSENLNPCKYGNNCTVLKDPETGFENVRCTCAAQYTGKHCDIVKYGEGISKEMFIFSPFIIYVGIILIAVYISSQFYDRKPKYGYKGIALKKNNNKLNN